MHELLLLIQFINVCSAFSFRDEQVNISTISIGKNVHVISGYVNVPIITVVDLEYQWCKSLTAVNTDVHWRWNVSRSMGSWDKYFPVYGINTYSNNTFSEIWGNSSYSYVRNVLNEGYERNKNVLTRVNSINMPAIVYGSSIVLPIYSALNDGIMLKDLCAYNEILGNNVLRDRWDDYYNNLMISLFNNKLDINIFSPKMMDNFVDLVHDLYGSIYKEDRKVLYEAMKIYLNLDEMESFFIRGYALIPYIEKIGPATFDVYSDVHDLYYTEIYSGDIRFSDASCSLRYDVFICDKVSSNSKKFTRLKDDVKMKYNLVMMKDGITCDVLSSVGVGERAVGPNYIICENDKSLNCKGVGMHKIPDYESKVVFSRIVDKVELMDLEDGLENDIILYLILLIIGITLFTLIIYGMLRHLRISSGFNLKTDELRTTKENMADSVEEGNMKSGTNKSIGLQVDMVLVERSRSKSDHIRVVK